MGEFEDGCRETWRSLGAEGVRLALSTEQITGAPAVSLRAMLAAWDKDSANRRTAIEDETLEIARAANVLAARASARALIANAVAAAALITTIVAVIASIMIAKGLI